MGTGIRPRPHYVKGDRMEPAHLFKKETYLDPVNWPGCVRCGLRVYSPYIRQQVEAGGYMCPRCGSGPKFARSVYLETDEPVPLDWRTLIRLRVRRHLRRVTL